MSLINDALRKAQKQRTGEAPPLASMPSVGGESPARIAKRAKPAGFNALLLRLGLGAGAILIVAGIGAYFVFRSPRTESTPPPAPSTAGATATPPQAPVPAAPTQIAEPTTPAFTLPIATPVVTSKPEPVATKAPAETVAAKPSAPVAKAPDEPRPSPPAEIVPAAPATPAPPAKMDNKAVSYIENLRIAGIRASATDAKVLMNDRVYRPGDMVERELGLKLVGITSGSLTFEDEQGARYTRSF